MKLKAKEVHGEPKKFSISILLYIAAGIAAILGIALLANNIFIFKTTVTQYVMQGYPAEEVMKSLIPAQLLPGIFEAVALYGGMSLALIGIGKGNSKLAQYAFASTGTAVPEEEEKYEGLVIKKLTGEMEESSQEGTEEGWSDQEEENKEQL